MRLVEQDRRVSYLTIAQAIVSGFGLVFALVGAGLLLVVGLAALFSETLDLSSATSMISIAWVGAFVAALALPSFLYSLRRVQGTEPGLPPASRLRLASILLMVWPLALLLGNLVAFEGTLAWLLLPPLHLLAVGLPIWWLVEFARWRLPAGSRQRGWGVINFSLLVTTPVVIMIEAVILILLLILFAVWASGRPEIMTQLEILAQRMLNSQPDPESMLRIARPYLQNPLVLVGTLALLAGLVPLIEELFKPLALWALAGRRLTPAEGFVAGAMSGAAFALLESLLSLTGTPLQNGWAVLAAGRAGTALLHITTTALVGQALAGAWQSGSYSRLGLTYLAAVGLHGLWNAFSVLSGFGVLLENPPDNLRVLSVVSQAAPIGIIFLVLLLALLLWRNNRHLREHTSPAVSTPALAANTEADQP